MRKYGSKLKKKNLKNKNINKNPVKWDFLVDILMKERIIIVHSKIIYKQKDKEEEMWHDKIYRKCKCLSLTDED